MIERHNHCSYEAYSSQLIMSLTLGTSPSDLAPLLRGETTSLPVLELVERR